MIYRLNSGPNLVFILGMVREGVENQVFFEFMNSRGFFDVLNEYKEHCFEIESTASCDLNIWCGSFSLIERISIEPKHQVCRQDFAVIISMYNTQDFVLRALDSILQQSIVPNEIFVVDDASTDESVQVIIEKYGNNKKIKLLKNKIKVGPFLNKNRVMKVLKEKYSYFAFLDSDDFILHETFSEMFHMIGINQNVKIVFPHMFRMENGTIYNFTISNTRCCLAGSLLRADLLDEIGYFEPLKYGADGGFFYRCQQKLESDEIIELKQPLYRAEIRLNSLTNCDSYVNLDDSSENYLSQDRQMYVDFFMKDVNKRITYMNSFDMPKKMLAVPIFFSEDVTSERISEGLILNKKYFDLAIVSIDMVIECLQLIGNDIFIDFNFQKTVAEDPKWLAFWRV